MELIENIVIACFILALIIFAAKHIIRIRVAKVCGIPISITGPFIFFVGFIGFVGGRESFFKILIAYFIVVLHELAHWVRS